MRALLEHGADAGAKDKKSRTPLHFAGRRGADVVVRALLEHGANAGAEDEDGRTPLKITSARGYDKIVELLSGHGARDVFSTSASGLPR